MPKEKRDPGLDLNPNGYSQEESIPEESIPEESILEEPSSVVSKDEFDGFKETVNAGFDKIFQGLESLKSSRSSEGESISESKIEGGTDDETPVPPAWKKLVYEILGEDFECELSLPESGGSIFRIIIPREKSNAPQMHWTMHMRDVRSRELGNTGVKGVKEWCLLVRKNLAKSDIKMPIYP